MEIDRLPARALYCHVTGERSQGRRAKKWMWMENIKQDFELRNIQLKMPLQRQNCMETAANIINHRHGDDGRERRKKSEMRNI